MAGRRMVGSPEVQLWGSGSLPDRVPVFICAAGGRENGPMTTSWRDLLLDQLDFYWQSQLWPRLSGLTDHEYLWEPVEGAWSLRPSDDGVVRIEAVVPEPPVPPVTTIAWRMAHIGRDVLGKRARAFFGGSEAPAEADMYDDRHWPEPLPLTASGGLELLEQGYTRWREGIAGLDDDALLQPLGAKGGPFADDSMAALAAHLNRETMAHGAEICLLRDLYRAQVSQSDPAVRAGYAGKAEDLEQELPRRGVTSLTQGNPSLLADAAALHHWEVVHTLVEHGFPVNSPTGTGATALHYCAAAGNHELARYLVDHGADPAATETAFGLDPAGWAEHFGHADIAGQLRGLPR
ncbi:MAG: ankyrin repeat domain-containing protein [Propionibacteriaceae bacterium]|nr:ankyrin repeat domain-containing protein [Propionibacteriaceae bacterium]